VRLKPIPHLDGPHGGAVIVLEGQHPLVRQAADGDDEGNPRVQRARMELDLGHDPSRRSARTAFRQRRDLLMGLPVPLDADGVVPTLALQQVKNCRNGDSGIGLEPLARERVFLKRVIIARFLPVCGTSGMPSTPPPRSWSQNRENVPDPYIKAGSVFLKGIDVTSRTASRRRVSLNVLIPHSKSRQCNVGHRTQRSASCYDRTILCLC